MSYNEFCSPDDPNECPGSPALQEFAEAKDRQAAHDRFHREHPGESCSPFDWPTSDYADIARGLKVIEQGNVIEPGDSFCFKGKDD